MDFDQTQAIPLDDYSDDTDDLGDPDDRQPAGYLQVFSQKSFEENSYPVYEGDNFVGRHESSQICIPLKALSKKHACIEIQGDSHLIYDLDSRNKTRRGKLFLKPSVRYELKNPDLLIFGDVRCQYTRAEVLKKPTEPDVDSDDADSGSDTGSESMLRDALEAGNQADEVKEPDFGSSSSYDILQPTQPFAKAETKKTIALETPQRVDATLVFAENSDENGPMGSAIMKADADSSISPSSVAETPTAKPMTAVPRSPFGLDASALAAAPTQPYGHLAEMETQAYPRDVDSDQGDEDVARGASLFDAPTQAFSVPDTDDGDPRQDGVSQGGRKTSLQPTLLLNLSTDDEGSPVRRLAGPGAGTGRLAAERLHSANAHEDSATLAYPDQATQAYCTDTDDDLASGQQPTAGSVTGKDGRERPLVLVEEEDKREEDQEPTLDFADLATQAYCADTDDDQASDVGAPGSATGDDEERPLVTGEEDRETTLDFADLATQAYCADTDDDQASDVGAPGSATGDNEERPLVTGEEDRETTLDFADLATQAYCADTDDQSEGEEATPGGASLAAVEAHSESLGARPDQAEAETLAYCEETESDTGDETGVAPQGVVRKGVAPQGVVRKGVAPQDALPRCLSPTLKYEEDEEEMDVSALAIAATQAYSTTEDDEEELRQTAQGAKGSLGDGHLPQCTDGGQRSRAGPTAREGVAGDAHLAEANTQEGRAVPMEIGRSTEEEEEMETQQATELEETDDTTAATQVYGARDSDDETPDILPAPASTPDRPQGATRAPAGSGGAGLRKAGSTTGGDVTEPEEMDDFVMATQVYGAANASETVPESQETGGQGDFEELLPGVSRISSMLRRKPARSALASPERRAPPRGHRVAFTDEIPAAVDDIAAPPSRRSARTRKASAKVREALGSSVTETDAKPTRRRSRDFRLLSEDEEDSEAPAPATTVTSAAEKPKERQEPADGLGRRSAEGGTSSETSLELADISERVWKTVGPAEETNNNEVGKPPARRTSRRQASYKKAVEGHDSDDTESISSTSSSIQVPVLEQPTGEPTKLQLMTVCDGKPSKRSSGSLAPSPRLRAVRDGSQSSSKEQDVPESIGRGGRAARATRGRSAAAADKSKAPVAKTEPAPKRRGRKPKSVPVPPTTEGSGQTSIRDSAADVQARTTSCSSSSSSSSGAKPATSGRRQSAGPESVSSLSPEVAPLGKSVEPGQPEGLPIVEVKTRPEAAPHQGAEKDAFVAPEPKTRGAGRGRRRAEKVEDGQLEPPATTPISRRGKRAAPTPALPTPSPAKRSRGQEATSKGSSLTTSPSLRNRTSNAKPKVMFTGVVSNDWEKIITGLGGELAGSVADCTHLVTDKVRRTVKFLCCLARGTPIISPKWLDQCQLCKMFVDPSPYLIQDKAAEKQYGFSHVTSHQRALQGRLLADFGIFVTPNVKPEPLQMKEIILSGGGKYLSAMPRRADPSTIVVSCETDEARCRPAIQSGLRVVTAEFILTGILRQEALPDLYQLFTPASSASDETGRVTSAHAGGKRRR